MKLFRRFRESVIPGNGLRKYLVYAIGEIVLVVIGILIAVAINNVNINSQKRAEALQTAKRVLQQVKIDTSEIKSVLREWDIIDKSIDTVLVYTKPDEPIAKCRSCTGLIIQFRLPNLSTQVENMLERQPLEDNDLGLALNSIQQAYRGFAKVNSIYEEVTTETLTENLKYLKNNYDWFARFSTQGQCGLECQDYFKNSPDFRNRVAYIYLILYNSYYGDLEMFLEDIEDDIVQLEETIIKEEQ